MPPKSLHWIERPGIKLINFEWFSWKMVNLSLLKWILAPKFKALFFMFSTIWIQWTILGGRTKQGREELPYAPHWQWQCFLTSCSKNTRLMSKSLNHVLSFLRQINMKTVAKFGLFLETINISQMIVNQTLIDQEIVTGQVFFMIHLRGVVCYVFLSAISMQKNDCFSLMPPWHISYI